MLGIPLKYNVRNLFVRKVTTTLTVLGIGLVVAVFLCVMSLGEGLTRVFTASGSENNVLVLRQNAQSELQSGISRDQVPLIMTLPGISPDADGKPLASPELVIVLNLEKRQGGSSNVTIRGIGEKGMKLRSGLTLVEGRMFSPGKSEVIVSKGVSTRFKDCTTGHTIKFGAYRWTVVGLFDAGGTLIHVDGERFCAAARLPYLPETFMKAEAEAASDDGAETTYNGMSTVIVPNRSVISAPK